MRGGTARSVASRLVVASVVVCGALAAAACDGLLGMTAPTLADAGDVDVTIDEGGADVAAPEAGPPAEAGPLDASTHHDASTSDASTKDAGQDAAPDADSGLGPDGDIRCGGGLAAEFWCNPSSQDCCQGGTVSAPTFMCVPKNSCAGYTIQCADYNDCNGSDICCRFNAHQICSSNCVTSEIVCDQATVDVCSGGKCDVPFIGDAAAASPYLGCGN